MGFLDSLFGGGQQQAYDDEKQAMQQGMQQAQNYEGLGEQALNPYASQGMGIWNQYHAALDQGANPYDLYQHYAQNYQMSPQAQAQLAYGQNAANNAAAASGMLGSGAEMQHAATRAMDMRQQDFNDFMDRMYNSRGQYLQGLGGMNQLGYGANYDIANMRYGLGNNIMDQYNKMGQAQGQADMAQSQGLTGFLGGALGLAGDIPGLGFLKKL